MEKTSAVVAIQSNLKQPTYYRGIPEYLKNTYWWAYLHPRAIRFFERQWLVNLILWGNYSRLCDAVINEINPAKHSKLLQMACVYGDLTQKIINHVGQKNTLDVVDVSAAQLQNTKAKVFSNNNLNLIRQDTARLPLSDQSYDVTLLFFLLHEQPEAVRQSTIQHALRVTKKGGKLIIVDYHKPKPWHPLRFIMLLIFKYLEPYAAKFVSQDVEGLLMNNNNTKLTRKTFFGGLYQKVVINC